MEKAIKKFTTNNEFIRVYQITNTRTNEVLAIVAIDLKQVFKSEKDTWDEYDMPLNPEAYEKEIEACALDCAADADLLTSIEIEEVTEETEKFALFVCGSTRNPVDSRLFDITLIQ